jgi:hypothetical protein
MYEALVEGRSGWLAAADADSTRSTIAAQREAQMNTSMRSLALAPVLLLTACVTVPSGPSVMVLPGTNKSFEAFQADNFMCQQFAQASLGYAGAAPGQSVTDPAAANAVIGGSLLGAASGAAIGAASGQAGPGAAIGAGVGLLLGSAAGSNSVGYGYYTNQRRYDNAYVQCMYAKGNQIPVRAGYRSGMPSRAVIPAG